MNYVLGKEQAALLHAEGVLAESNRDIIRSFILQAGMNPDLKKPVGHIALSYSPVDAPKLTDGKMIQLAQEYMREMKITDTQYIIVRHQDREHPHVHIVFNRRDNNGKTISDRNDMYRNEQSGNQGTGSSYKPGWQKRVSGFISSTGDRLAKCRAYPFPKVNTRSRVRR